MDNVEVGTPTYRAKIHWISYVFPIFNLVLGIIALVVITQGIGLLSAIFLPFIYLGLKAIVKISTILTTSVYMDENYITAEFGLFNRQSHTISRHKIEGMSLYQNFLGRLLNYGTFIISTGEISNSVMVANPHQFRKELIKYK